MARVSIVLLLFGGCTLSGGEALYFLGLGRGKLVKAKFRLTRGPVLILVDDPAGRIDWPMTRRYLVDDISEALISSRAATKIVPRETIDQLRQTHRDFDKRGCREIGALAGAEQVVWIEVQDFLADEQVFEPTNAAYLSASVKVINALEEDDRNKVRLWPDAPSGHLIVASLEGSTVARAKTKDAICRLLSRDVAQRVAKLFYDHRLGDFEKEE